MIKRISWMVIGWAIVSSIAWAEMDVRNSPVDGRVTTLEYRKGEVYSINGRYGQQTVVRFHEDEDFRFIGGGNDGGWEITRYAHMLSIIPLSYDVNTNLNITTQDRVTGELRYYVFALNALAANSDEIETWSVEFKNTKGRELPYYSETVAPPVQRSEVKEVPAPSKGPLIALAAIDANYGYNGDAALIPRRIFDDGKFTYFEFPETMMPPMILAIEDGGQRLIVNRHEAGIYTVVQQVADGYILMLGDLEARIHYQGKR